MSIPIFTKDMNIIGALADQPTESASSLKANFDEGGKAIKDYINGTGDFVNNGLVEKIGEEITAKVTEGVNVAKGYADDAVEALEEGQVATNSSNISTLQTTVAGHTNSINSLNTQIAGTLKYSSFVETVSSTVTLNHGHGGVVSGGLEMLNAGYYPLAVSGYEVHCYNDGSNPGSAMYGEQENGLIRCYIGEKSSGRAGIYYSVQNRDNQQWTYRSTLRIWVLWVKV